MVKTYSSIRIELTEVFSQIPQVDLGEWILRIPKFQRFCLEKCLGHNKFSFRQVSQLSILGNGSWSTFILWHALMAYSIEFTSRNNIVADWHGQLKLACFEFGVQICIHYYKQRSIYVSSVSIVCRTRLHRLSIYKTIHRNMALKLECIH